MSFSIVFLALGVFAITQQADARCLFKPPFKCKYTSLPGLLYKFGSQSALPAPPPPLPKCGLLPPAGPPKFDFFPPSGLSKFSSPPSSALSKFGLPTLTNFLPCPRPATKVTNKPDVTIPLPLPAEIPVGKFCTCQKFSIQPTVVPCAPAAALIAPPVAAPAPLPNVAPPLTLSPELLNAILAGVAPDYSCSPALAAAPTSCTCV